MPVLPVCLTEPLWITFAVLPPERLAVSPTHPLGGRLRRVLDRVVFDQCLAVLVHGSGYGRNRSPACSERTIRRRLREWAALGITDRRHTLALQADDQMIGLDLEDLAADGWLHHQSPDGRKKGTKYPTDGSLVVPMGRRLWPGQAPTRRLRPFNRVMLGSLLGDIEDVFASGCSRIS